MYKKLIYLVIMCFLATIPMAGCYQQERERAVSMKYPVKPITVIVPYTAGGSTDIMVRAMEKGAMKYMDQPLIITNIPGGGGNIGWNELAGANPDGYTLGAVGTGTILQTLYGQTRYHYVTALEPIVQVADFPIVVAVRADQPWQNIGELIKFAKAHPGEVKFGHSGVGLAVHITGEMLAKEAGIGIVPVPFRGDSEGIAALLGGHIQLLFGTAGIKEQITGGNVRVLAVASEKRSTIPELKDVPTLKEQGINVAFSIWQGIGAPKTMPSEVKVRLAEVFKNIVNDPDFKNHVEKMGMSVEYMGPQEISEKWITESGRLDTFLKESGIVDQIATQKK
ncbi:Bug family tripartite tricarboxylate transporter substrate binding protein [Sporomusa aerivorans]|uniref:Bug family tripartite tricarboxylate transporter substrate binding protein n=1 Tax=Sporomusa aerivorans TaxID=204936 RepID=UPI00352A5369